MREQGIARDLIPEIRSPPGVPGGGGPGLPDAGPRRAHAVGRRGAAHPPGGAARLQPAGRVLRAGRAHHRPARARQPDPAGRAAQAGRQGQHAGGGGARRGHHPPRRPHHRHRPERGQARRPRGRAGHGRGGDGQRGVADRPLPAACDEAPAAAAPPWTRCTTRAGRHPGRERRCRGQGQEAALAAGADGQPAAGRGGAPPASCACRAPTCTTWTTSTSTCRCKRLVVVTGVSGSGKSTLARDVLLHNVQAVVQQRSTKAGRDADDRRQAPGVERLQVAGRLPGASTACWKWTRRRSARRRAPARPPTSASGTPSASCSPTRWRPRRAATARAASPSTPARAAARCAKARACAPSR